MANEGDLPTRVGIGLIEREGCYLIRQRPSGSIMAGYWEFPGGKCEPGEPPEAATGRECLEEVGIVVDVGERVAQFVHRYPHGLVELYYYWCTTHNPRAEPSSRSGFVWVSGRELPGYRFPEANEALIALIAAKATG